MEPTLHYPFNVRSFFTEQEKKEIGSGIVLWRGYFQSVRPAPGRMLINIDISTGMMYKPGQLINLCLEFLGRRNPNDLAPSRGFPEREQHRLNRFIGGVKVITTSGNGQQSRAPRGVKKLTQRGARHEEFDLRLETGGTRKMSVADYFQRVCNRPLQFPDLPCAEVCLRSSSHLSPPDHLALRSGMEPRSRSSSAWCRPVRSCANKYRQRRPRTSWTSQQRDPRSASQAFEMVSGCVPYCHEYLQKLTR